MREIKFRSWLKNENCFIYDFMLRSDCESEKETHVLQQYTGLEDKNGKEIYEGDIVRYIFDLPGSIGATKNGLKERIGEVFWCEWRSSFAVYGEKKLSNNDLFRYIRNGNRVEVIGNIYENENLIGE